jgi:hypothetical protein
MKTATNFYRKIDSFSALQNGAVMGGMDTTPATGDRPGGKSVGHGRLPTRVVIRVARDGYDHSLATAKPLRGPHPQITDRLFVAGQIIRRAE